MENIFDKFRILAKTGIDIPEIEKFLLQKQLEKLSSLNPENIIQFFGVIFCTGRDYFIFYSHNQQDKSFKLNTIDFFVS